jgi:hypothetical protein
MNNQVKDPLMDPAEVRQLLHHRAQQVQVHGDFSNAAITGARHVRTRRAVTATVAAALAVALPIGLASLDRGVDRGGPATSTVTVKPAPTVVEAVARVAPAEGAMAVPYIQAGLLHLNGRTFRVPVEEKRQLRLFATLSNGGVAYQGSGPDPAAPGLDTGPLTFLDRNGVVVAQHPDMAQADADGPGDRVTAVAASGEFVVFDVNGSVLRRLASLGDFQSTSHAEELGEDLVANLAGHEDPATRIGSLATGRSAYIDISVVGADARAQALTLHDGRTLYLQGPPDATKGEACKHLTNYLNGKPVRSWCDDRLPIGFSPDGAWMYGKYYSGPGVWVERTDDGARLLEIRTDDATQDRFTAEYPAPSPDGSALLVVLADQNEETVVSSCTITTGECRVLSDKVEAPVRGWLHLPDNLGRQQMPRTAP